MLTSLGKGGETNPLHTFPTATWYGVVDKAQDARAVMRSNPIQAFSFIFQFENILQSNSKLSSSYGR